MCYLFSMHMTLYYVLGEALDRIKITFVDKAVQCKTEIHENTHVNQLHMTNFEKKVTPTTERNTGPIKDYSRMYMAIKALYNSKLEHRDN